MDGEGQFAGESALAAENVNLFPVGAALEFGEHIFQLGG